MRNVSLPRTFLALATAAVLATGCQSGFEINSPSNESTSATSYLAMTVDPGSNGINAFELSGTEYARVSLVGLIGADPQRPLDVTMGLRTGFFAETGCSTDNPNLDVKTRPTFVAQEAAVLSLGTYCVEVYDVGNLTETVTALVRVVHPAPRVSGSPGTTVGGSNVTVAGASSRSFDVNAPGMTNITLIDLQPNVQTGLGIGFQQTDGTGCKVTRSINATARATPAHFSVDMDPGQYCVQVFDIGNYTRTTSYVFQIVHP